MGPEIERILRGWAEEVRSVALLVDPNDPSAALQLVNKGSSG
jgi:hypothetical protein